MKIILPIKPIYADKILLGEKFFELRKIIPQKKFDTILIYATSPISKIIGEVKVDEIIKSDIDNLWNITKNGSCVNKKFFDNYFEGKEIGYAIKIKDSIRYEKGIDITKYTKSAPQGFVYIE